MPTNSKEYMREYMRGYRSTARVQRAVSEGVLVKPIACEECGTARKRITAAHRDHTLPLDVRWLCWPCRRRWDAARAER